MDENINNSDVQNTESIKIELLNEEINTKQNFQKTQKKILKIILWVILIFEVIFLYIYVIAKILPTKAQINPPQKSKETRKEIHNKNIQNLNFVIAAKPKVVIKKLSTEITPDFINLNIALDKLTYEYSVTSLNKNNTLSFLIEDASLAPDFRMPEANDFAFPISVQYAGNTFNIKIDLESKMQLKILDLIENKDPEVKIVFSREKNISQDINFSVQKSKEEKILPQSVEESYDVALSYLKNDPDVAATKLKDIVAKHKDFLPAREALISLLIDEENFQDAKKIIDDGLQIDHNNLTLIRLKALLFAKKNETYKALKLLQSHLPEKPSSDPEYYAATAALYLKNKDFKSAADIYSRLVVLPNPDGNNWLGLATALEGKGNINSAKIAYFNALQSDDLSYEMRSYIEQKIKTTKY